MDIPATQIFDDEDESPTQIIGSFKNEHKPIGTLQVGTQTYPINKGINKVGRHPACEIYINDETISKQHAEIEATRSQASVWICDMNSSNKTKLNDTVLRPGRLYELNNGSVIKFGRVRAVYKCIDPLDDSVIPETPAPLRQKSQQGVIPATPDSSLNYSSSSGKDVSTIPGTQGYEEQTTFRCPAILRYKQSINTSSRSANQTPDKDGSAEVSLGSETSSDREISIYDMETQKSFEGQNERGDDIHDAETQRICLNAPAVSNIHEMETQIDMEILNSENQSKSSDIHEMETQIDVEMLNSKTQSNSSDIHEMETQHPDDFPEFHVSDADETIKNKKSINGNIDTELGKNRMVQAGKDMSVTNDHDDSISELETQKIDPQRLKDMLRLAANSNAKEIPENKTNENIDNEHHVDKVSNKTIDTNSNRKGPSPFRDSASPPQKLLPLSLGSDFEESSDDLDETENKSGSQDLLADLENEMLLNQPIASTSKEQIINESSDEDNIFDAVTQIIPKDPEIRKSITQRDNNVLDNLQLNEDCETDEEGLFTQFCHKGSPHKNAKELNEIKLPNSDNVNKLANTIKDAEERELTKSSPLVDDTAPTQIIKLMTDNTDTTESSSNDSLELTGLYSATNCGIENIEYEMAPTQLISESPPKKETMANNIKDTEKKLNISDIKNSKRESKSKSNINLNDTIERNLNEMFEEINPVNYDEPLPLSTQCLEEALTSKPTESDSQTTDNYFSTLSSTRKRNILKDSQDTVESNDDDAKSSGAKDSGNNKSESDSPINTSKVNTSDKANDEKDDNTIISEEKQRNESSSVSDKNQQQDCNNLNTTQLGKEVTDSGITETSASMEILSAFADSEDIMAGLPEVRISGTISNPPSPTSSISSWSCISKDREKPSRKAEKTKVKAASKAKKRKTNVKRIIDNAEPHETIRNTRSTNLSINLINSFPGDLNMYNVSVKVVRCDDMYEINSKPVESSEAKRFVRRSFKHDVTQERLPLQEKSISLNLSLTENLHNSRINVSKVSLTRNTTRTSHHSNAKNGDRSYIFQVTNDVPEDKVEIESTKKTGANVSLRGKRSQNKIDEVPESPVKKRKVSVSKENEMKPVEVVPRSTRGRKRNITKATNSRQSPTIPTFFAKRVSPVTVDSSKNTVPLNDSGTTPKTNIAKEVETVLSSTKPSMMSVPPKKRTRRVDYKSDETKDSSSDISGNEVSKNIKISQIQTTVPKSRNKKQETEAIVKAVGEESQEVEMIMNQSLMNEKNKTEEKVELAPQGKKRRGRKRAIANETAINNVDEKKPIDSSLVENPVFEAPTTKPKRARVTRRATTSTIVQNEETITNNGVSSRSTRGNSLRKSIATTVTKNEDATRNNVVSLRSTRSNSVQKSSTDSSVEDTIESSILENSVAKMNATTKPRGRGRKRKEEKKEEEVHAEDTSIQNTSIMLTPGRMRRSMSSAHSMSSSPSRLKHKILFTGITNSGYQKIITKLGASQVEDPAKCTVLVTDKVRRTVKFLCALSKSVPIVSVNWLLDSEKVGQFIDLNDYLLHDTEAETKFGFQLKNSLEKAKEHSLLGGYSVVLTPNVAPPPLPELKSIISACGGKPLVRPPTSWPEKAIIVSREEDIANARKFSAKAPEHVSVQSTEFILTGILRQDLNFTEYKLL